MRAGARQGSFSARSVMSDSPRSGRPRHGGFRREVEKPISASTMRSMAVVAQPMKGNSAGANRVPEEVHVKVYRDQATAYSTERLHPYQAMDDSQSGFVDFVQHPDQIPIALEDFQPFGDRSAVQTFYDFLRWLNGRDGHLQSCDFAFRPAASHADTNSHYTLSAIGRLFIMFRDLRFNCSNPHTEWLCDRLMHYLTEVDQDMSVAEGVVGFTLNPVLHLDLAQGFWRPTGEYDVAADSPGYGRHLTLNFFAYGNDERHVFNNLERLFRNLWSACRLVSDEIEEALSAGVAK
jgi:hypothetical protein